MRRAQPCVALLLAAFASWGCARAAQKDDTPADGGLLRNPSFEEDAGPIPAGWTFEKKAVNKGAVSVSAQVTHSGAHALRISPNERNTGGGIARDPLGVGQAFFPGRFRGRKVYLSGWIGASGGATAVVGLYVFKLGGSVSFVELKQSFSSGLQYHEDVLNVPNSFRILFAVVNCHAEGTSGAAWFDDISVSLDPPRNALPAGPLQASAEIDAGHELRRIPNEIFGTNIEWIWDGNGLWNAAEKGLDSSLVALTRDLGVTGIRFPGGVFADFYHWKDGIGPQDRRPVRMSMPGGTKSGNAFGIDEALEFSKRTGAPLIMTVNIVTGTPAEAVDLLRYVKMRAAATGAPKVTDWELGNEQYVHDGSPHAREAGMTPEHYADVWLEFADALKKEDSSIRLGAIADENYSTIVPGYRGWTETVLKKTGGRMDFLSVHNAYAPAVIDAQGLGVREIYEAMFAAPLEIATALDNTADKIERFGGNGSDRIGIAVTEWGPFFHLLPSSPFVDHVKTLGSAIYVASALRAFIASPRVQSADFFKLNDELFMGWIGKRNGEWTPKAPYYAFQMFRRHFGTRLIGSSTDSPSYSSHTVGWTAGMPQVPYVETLASRSEDGRTLYVMAINKNIDSTIPLQITLRNAKASGKATVWTMTGRSLDANTGTRLPEEGGVHWARQAEDDKNPRFDKGANGEIWIQSAPLAAAGNLISVPLPRLSVVSLEIPLQ